MKLTPSSAPKANGMSPWLQTLIYSFKSLKSIMKSHKIKIPDSLENYSYRSLFSMTPHLSKAWSQLYQERSLTLPFSEQKSVPFLFFESVGTHDVFAILSDLGVSLRHVLNLRTELLLIANPGTALIPNHDYTVISKLIDISPFGSSKRMVVAIEVTLFENDKTILRFNTFILVNNVNPKTIEILLQKKTHWTTSAPREYSRNPASQLISPLSASTTQMVALNFTEDMGIGYGAVSGDMNLVHVSKWASWIFGFKRPFIQGLCIVNYILFELAKRHHIKSLGVQYCKPIFLPQICFLLYDQTRLEILDANFNVLLIGTWNGIPDEGLARSHNLSRVIVSNPTSETIL